MNRVTLVRAPAGELPVAFPQVPPQWQPIGLVQLVVEAGYAWRAWQASVLARLRDAGKLRHHVARKMWRVAHA